LEDDHVGRVEVEGEASIVQYLEIFWGELLYNVTLGSETDGTQTLEVNWNTKRG
jgi:hypothetical protein